MNKIGRNMPCPCGSGIKYKKCCINTKRIFKTTVNKEDSFKEFISKNDSVELLKIVALLQVLPKNQSKEFRLEQIQKDICLSLNQDHNTELNISKYLSLIKKNFPHNPMKDDPCESCFTENIIFYNGNNIVFPGMSVNSTHIVQNLINSVIRGDRNIDKGVKTKILDGVTFMLHIHNSIAEKMGYKRYMSEDKDWQGDIFIPNNDFVSKYSKLFEFTKNELDEIYKQNGIKSDIIHDFVTDINHLISDRDKKENSLTFKPFIKVNDKFILTMPSCEMLSLNKFIINKIKEVNQYPLLIEGYNESIRYEVGKVLHSIWEEETLKLPLYDNESIWRLDTNKIAYVRLIDAKDKNLDKRASEVIKIIKNEINDTSHEFLCSFIIAPNTIGLYSSRIEKIKESKYQFIIDCFDLERLVTIWKIDNLSFWKFFKAKERASKHVMMLPQFSILSYYKWFKKNHESFFLSDDITPNYIAFDFSIQGDLMIESNQKNDRHVIPYIHNDQGLIFISVYKVKDFAPIYTSEEIFNGEYREAIEKYNCPIWISIKNKNQTTIVKPFFEAILFWLNELHSSLSRFLIPLENLPIEFIIGFKDSIYDLNTNDLNTNELEKVKIEYKVFPSTRKIEMILPNLIFNALNRSDNHGERILMSCIIQSLGDLLKLTNRGGISEEQILLLLEDHIPLGRAKMLLTNTSNSIKRQDLYIAKSRHIQDSDISIVLEENVGWLNEEVPKKVSSDKEKVNLLVKIINSLILQLRKRLKEYNSLDLLKNLMAKHEALIYEGANWDVQIPARIECFSKYDNVIREFSEEENRRVKTTLATRCLIEFVNAEPYIGKKKINNDDVDFLLALMVEIINNGTLKDAIYYNLSSPKMVLLPSGRIGIDHGFYTKVLSKYRDAVTDDSIIDFEESFESNFRNSKSESKKVKVDNYHEIVDKTFADDWGISLSKISNIINYLIDFCIENRASFYTCSENEFDEILNKNKDISQSEILAFKNKMLLVTRGKMDIPSDRKSYPEIFPWRYNRSQSYLSKPILKLKYNEDYQILFSIRHLESAEENLYAIFYNGTLKVDNKYKNINKLLAKRNNIKGEKFRQNVYDWLISNTTLEVIPHEVKIKERGILKADRNYGDVDILAFNHSKKIVYSIECKNTKQAKVMHDFSSNLKNYTEKQLPKHIEREKWLKRNIKQVSEKFSLGKNKYRIESIVISSNQLPVKFIKNISIPLYSFNELKNKNVFK
ncbi:SEC-C metal-binding domain-containing protein [Tenacibaculum sp. ZH5_bin.1]|uniref:YecA family protein n=1 Tax=unclassified Tenacibaculum TaxID=2635139 RepID=UPI0036E87A47